MSFRFLALVAVLVGIPVLAAEPPKPKAPSPPPPTPVDKAAVGEDWDKELTPGEMRKLERVSGPAPLLCFVTKIDTKRGMFMYAWRVTGHVTEVRTVKILDVERQETVRRQVTSTISVRASFEQTAAYDVKGKRLKEEDAIKRLALGQTVVVSEDGRLPDAEYLRVLKDDTLILVPPPATPLLEYREP